MAKLITVDRARLDRARREMERVLEKDPNWQATWKEIKRYMTREKARRNAEYKKSRRGAL